MEPPDSLPELKLVLLVPDELPLHRQAHKSLAPRRTRPIVYNPFPPRPVRSPASTPEPLQLAADDSRWAVAQEFLDSSNFSPNSSYARKWCMTKGEKRAYPAG